MADHNSWLNQIERFVSVFADRAIRRGWFTSVQESVAKINHVVALCKLTLQEARNYDEVYENYPARFRMVASRPRVPYPVRRLAAAGTGPKRPLRGRHGWG